MIADCREAGLPELDFEQRGPHFVVTLWRDWLTEEVLAGFNLNERQIAGLACLRSEGRLTSGSYQNLTGISRQTATRDMEDLVKKGILERHGERRGTFYVKTKEMPQV
jgi:ATP-dependent DNA helicase RecG